MPPKKKTESQTKSASTPKKPVVKAKKPARFYQNLVEIAPTARTTCLTCDKVIEKGDYRVTEVDASRAYQYRGSEGESRGYGVFKAFVHLTCHEPPASYYPLEVNTFKFKKFGAKDKKAFDEWLASRNERGPGEEDYLTRNKKWLDLVDMEGGLVYSRNKLAKPRKLKDDGDDEERKEDSEEKNETKSKTPKKSAAKSRKRGREDDEQSEGSDYEKPAPKKRKTAKK